MLARFRGKGKPSRLEDALEEEDEDADDAEVEEVDADDDDDDAAEEPAGDEDE